MKKTIRVFVSTVLKGMAMGAADVVPGVSGGTIAFITGIYEELINSIKSINYTNLKLILKAKFKEFFQAINGRFLFTLFFGIAISIITLSKIIRHLLNVYPIFVWSFFFGLIVASAIVVAKRITERNTHIVIVVLLGALFSYYVTILNPISTAENYLFIFFTGAIAVCAMILPGISGAFMLLLLGKYTFTLEAVNELRMDIIITLGAGAVIGLISFSNLLSWLLKRYHNLTIAFLSGFMIGSLNKVWVWKRPLKYYTNSKGELKPLIEENVLPSTYAQFTQQDPKLFGAIIFAIVGFLAVYGIEKLARNKTTNK